MLQTKQVPLADHHADSSEPARAGTQNNQKCILAQPPASLNEVTSSQQTFAVFNNLHECVYVTNTHPADLYKSTTSWKIKKSLPINSILEPRGLPRCVDGYWMLPVRDGAVQVEFLREAI